MKTRPAGFAMTLLLLPVLSLAQDAALKIPDFAALAGKATESVNITLSPWLLRMAGTFVDDKDADSAATKRLLAGVKSIQVRSYQFASDFAYSMSDIDAVRRQLAAPGWSQLMQVHNRDKNEDVGVYILVQNQRTNGLALITSAPRQFTIINIVGSISVEDLPKLEHDLHLPTAGTGAGTGAGQIGLLM
jgi:hypothetical protein